MKIPLPLCQWGEGDFHIKLAFYVLLAAQGDMNFCEKTGGNFAKTPLPPLKIMRCNCCLFIEKVAKTSRPRTVHFRLIISYG